MNPVLLALDPLLKINVKLFISHILKLQRAENVAIELYNFHNHIIKFVEICGLVVGVENKSSQVYYTVDDSTGTIPCCYWTESNFNYKPIELGKLVRVLGKIATYRDQKQLIIDDIFIMENPNEETAHFIEKYTLLEEYKKPYKLPTEQDIIHDLRDPRLEVNEDKYALGFTANELSSLIFDSLSKNYEKNEPFSMTQVHRNPQLVEFAEQILVHQGENLEPYRIKELFDEAINKLISNGLLTPEGTKNGVYTLVDKIEIEQFVMGTISKICKLSDARGGINRAYIIAKLKENYGLEKKAAGIVAQITIKDLLEKGSIYPTGDKRYRVTFE